MHGIKKKEREGEEEEEERLSSGAYWMKEPNQNQPTRRTGIFQKGITCNLRVSLGISKKMPLAIFFSRQFQTVLGDTSLYLNANEYIVCIMDFSDCSTSVSRF